MINIHFDILSNFTSQVNLSRFIEKKYRLRKWYFALNVFVWLCWYSHYRCHCPSLCLSSSKDWNGRSNIIKLQKALYSDAQCPSRNMVQYCSSIGISWWANLFEAILLSSLKHHALQAAKIKTAKFTPNLQL